MPNQSQLTGEIEVAAQGIYSESSTALHVVGSRVETNDGRTFRYTLAGGTSLVAGKLYQAAAEDTTNQQSLTVTAPVAGATSVVTTTTVTLALNLLAGGFMTIISASTGAGFMYRIQGNTAATTAVTTFTLDDPIVVAPTGTVIVDVKINPYSKVVVDPTTATSAPVGVAVYNVTNAYYGWLQTHGPATVLAQGTVTVGDNIKAANSTNAGGAVSATNGVVSSIGYAIQGIASTDYGMVFLTID